MNHSELENTIIEWQCQKLVIHSVNLLDQCRWQELSECYTEDAELYRPSAPLEKIEGRDAILASFNARPEKETCHALSNIEVSVIDSESAQVTSRVALFAGNEKVQHVGDIGKAKTDVFIGRFIDCVRKIDGHWLIAKRQGSIELHYKGNESR